MAELPSNDTASASSSTLPSSSTSSASETASFRDIATPWVNYTVAQAAELRLNVAELTETALRSTRSHLLQLQSASSHGIHSAKDLLKSAQLEYRHYEELFFQQVKGGLHKASEHPGISFAAAAGFGLLAMKRPRTFIFRHTLGRFQSEEVLFANAERKVQELRQIFHQLRGESQKLEERATLAENELQRGQTKLKQVGEQLLNLVNSVHKSEARAKGLVEHLHELRGRDALEFRAEVALMAAEARKQRNVLTKRVMKIADYGIPV